MRMQRLTLSNRARLPEMAVGFALAFGLPMASNVLYALDSEAVSPRLTKASRMATCQQDGTTYFALSLVSGTVTEASVVSRVAVIVDTSASQNGVYRRESMEVAKSIIESLPEGSIVSLLSCDVEPELYAGGRSLIRATSHRVLSD